ncbi:MAG: ABC transporter permease [Acetobacteraceae bacterium]
MTLGTDLTVAAGVAEPSAAPSDRWTLARWLALRILFSVLVLVMLSIFVFAATTVLPGNVADIILGQDATPSQRAAVIHQLHLDQPAPVRYLHWMGGVVHLDFGESLESRLPVFPTIATAFGNSLILAGAAAVVMICGSVWIGLWSGLRAGSPWDRLVTLLTFISLSMPEFVFGSILIWLFVILIPLLPALSLVDSDASIGEWVVMLILPVVTAVPVTMAYIVRTMRQATVDVLDLDFIEMAELRGLPRRRIIWRHVLPNALVPMINVLTLNMGGLVGGVVVVEVLFQYPGIGRLLLESVEQRDLPMVQGAAMLIGIVYVVVNLVADIGIAVLDPRVGRRFA